MSHIYIKRSFYQDRLGTNIGKTPKSTFVSDGDGQISQVEFNEIIRNILDSPEHKYILDQQRFRNNVQKFNLKNIDLTHDEVRQAQIRREGPCYIRDASGKYATLWDIIQTLLLVYIAVNVPLDFANFSTKSPVPPTIIDGEWDWGNAWFWIDFLTFLLFMTDMLLTFVTSTEDIDKNPVLDLRMIGKRYCCGPHYLCGLRMRMGWFFLDFVSVFPDLLVYVPMAIEFGKHGTVGAVSTGQTGDIVRATKLVTKAGRFTKLLKLVRVAKSFNLLKKYGDIMSSIMKAVAYVLLLIWLLHFFACGWFVAGDRIEECTATGPRSCSRQDGYYRNEGWVVKKGWNVANR